MKVTLGLMCAMLALGTSAEMSYDLVIYGGTLVSGLTESTVEFFFKIPAGETIIPTYCRSCAMAAGKDGDALQYLCLSIPLSVTDKANFRHKYVAAFANGHPWGKYSEPAPTSLADGAWHHVAIDGVIE